MATVDVRRTRILKDGEPGSGPVLYVMSRDFRVDDNWGLLYAQEVALKHKVPLGVLVHMGKHMVRDTARHRHFLVEGLRETARDLEQNNIPFFITFGDLRSELLKFVELHAIGLIVTDFSPLRECREMWEAVLPDITVPVHQVDAHNTVPVWVVSDKEEYSAYTFRLKHDRLYKEFKGAIPAIMKHPVPWGATLQDSWPRGRDDTGTFTIDWDGIKAFSAFDVHVDPVGWCQPGTTPGLNVLQEFITERLDTYHTKRNDPNARVQSDLSPYIRFGHVSTQRIAEEVAKSRMSPEAKQHFLEELIIRKELAENFCYYQPSYDSLDGVRDWARTTLDAHRDDDREYTYALEEFEGGKTHDQLWNAAQREMVVRGKMNGYLRMYWAKKILEWARSPEEAVTIAVTLNDRYQLDGRSPNGYVGVLWSIGGVHDRPWMERPVYGRIRYMNESGCKRKFDVARYVDFVEKL